MKKSNKLLIALYTIIFAAMIGYSFAVKSEYDKYDKNDPYYGYYREELKPLRFVKFEGMPNLHVTIKKGIKSEMIMKELGENEKKSVTITKKQIGDTLFIKVTGQKVFSTFNDPFLFITTPSLHKLEISNSHYRLFDFKQDSLLVIQSGNNGSVNNSQVQNLTVKLTNRGEFKINGPNGITSANLSIFGNSILTVGKNIFTTFELDIDSTSSANLPGSLIKERLK